MEGGREGEGKREEEGGRERGRRRERGREREGGKITPSSRPYSSPHPSPNTLLPFSPSHSSSNTIKLLKHGLGSCSVAEQGRAAPQGLTGALQRLEWLENLNCEPLLQGHRHRVNGQCTTECRSGTCVHVQVHYIARNTSKRRYTRSLVHVHVHMHVYHV